MELAAPARARLWRLAVSVTAQVRQALQARNVLPAADGLANGAIAREAQVADGVLYNHFADKEELLALALHAHVHTVERRLGQPPRLAGEGTLEANLRAYVAHGLALHIAILPAFAGLVHQPKVFTRFDELPNPMAGGRGLRADLAGYLRAEQRLGRLAPGASAEAAATMIIGACHELVLPGVFSGSPITLEQVPSGFIDELVSTIVVGIGPENGS